MEDDTRKLLEECNSGCRMGVNSIEQVSEYVKNEDLNEVIAKYKSKNQKLEQKSSEMLKEYGETGKNPGAAASAFSWITTEMKLMLKDDSSQIAKLLMDGCNMGIQSISEYQNQYKQASKESIGLAKDLVKTEEEFMKELKQFL